MKVLVTGGLGFIGSNFILHVLKNHPDFKIVNLDAGLIGSNEKNLKSVEKSENYRLVHGNINDKKLDIQFSKFKISMTFRFSFSLHSPIGKTFLPIGFAWERSTFFHRHFERSPEAKRRDDVRNLTAFSETSS